MDVYLYGICLALGLMFTIISALVGHLFGGDGTDVGTGGHAEAGFADSGVPGISFFSPTVLASFVTAFGACGLILRSFDLTSPLYISAPASALAGGVIALGVFCSSSTRCFRKTQSSSEGRVASLTGQPATIVTPIPVDGVGEIAYVQSGSRYTAPARSLKNTAIAAGQPVRIARIVGTQFYVEPME
jgi:membrane protein implicated in regulation of membrane protease activity